MRAVKLPLPLAERSAWAQSVVVARITLGLTQQRLAERAGIYQDQLSKYERDAIAISPRMRARIAAAIAELQAEAGPER